MNKYIAILLLVFPGSAYGEVLRCKGEYSAFEGTVLEGKYPIQLDIVLPESYKLFGQLITHSGKPKDIFIPYLGEGIIETSIGGGKRFRLIVTQRPRSVPDSLIGYSLIGFYYEAAHVHTIRVDTWNKSKPFFYYQSYTNRLYTGNCE